MDVREAYKVFMGHQLEFGIEGGHINCITVNDVEGVLEEFENNPDFHERMARFLNEELER